MKKRKMKETIRNLRDVVLAMENSIKTRDDMIEFLEEEVNLAKAKAFDLLAERG